MFYFQTHSDGKLFTVTQYNYLTVIVLCEKVTVNANNIQKIMAVHIRLIRNNIKSSKSFGKYFAKSVSQGEVTLSEIAEEACRNSGFTEGAVIGVVTELQDLLKEKLANGQTVVLPGIGRFSLRVESKGVDDPKDFNIRRHITRVVCRFLPAGRRVEGRHILYDFCDGVKAVWHMGCKP